MYVHMFKQTPGWEKYWDQYIIQRPAFMSVGRYLRGSTLLNMAMQIGSLEQDQLKDILGNIFRTGEEVTNSDLNDAENKQISMQILEAYDHSLKGTEPVDCPACGHFIVCHDCGKGKKEREVS
jgi:hypothetical protein